MKNKIVIKTSSYTDNFPKNNCIVKVAVKPKNWKNNDVIKAEVFEDAIYEDGFVTIDTNSYMAGAFIFHKLKRKVKKNEN